MSWLSNWINNVIIGKGLLVSKIEKHADDFELLNLAKQGNNLAFRELVERHKSRIAATIYGMLGKCDEADDIGQEVFIRFYNSMNNFRGDSSLVTYLTRIAINLSLNEIKRRNKRKILSFDNMVENGFDISSGSDEVRDRENVEIVRMAIRMLSPKYRSVLVLRLVDGFSSEETSKILKIPLGTVLSRLARAQKKLKEYLEKLK